MNWRIAELAHFAADIDWLDAVAAAEAYELMRSFDSRTRLGLDSTKVKNIERLEFGDDVRAGTAWLQARLSSSESLVVVFGNDDCFRCDAAFFVNNWQDIFLPARDDAMVYSESSNRILFVNHESEFETGQRPL